MQISKVQFYVPQSKQSSKPKLQVISVIAAILIFIILIVFLCFAASSKKQEKLFLVQNYYFVYTSCSRKEIVLDEDKEKLKKLGGANVVHYFKNYYYLIASVSFDKAEAEQLSQKMKNEFSSAGVLRISSKEFPKSLRLKVFNNFDLTHILKRVSEMQKQMIDLLLMFENKSVDAGNVIKTIQKQRLELEMLKERLDCANIQEKDVFNFIEQWIQKYNEFASVFYPQEHRRLHNLSKLVVEGGLLMIEMSNNMVN